MEKESSVVLIVDVLGSSSAEGLRSTVTRKLDQLSRTHTKRQVISLPYAVTAGDEFQTLTLRLDAVPELVLDLRVAFRPLGLWIGVGIGGISGPVVQPVNRMTGEAFVFARQALESIKSSKAHKFKALTAFQSGDRRFDLVANSVYGLHDTLVQAISSKQWKTIEVYRKTRRVELTAKALGVNESTVSRNLKRGHFWQLEETVEIMRTIIGAHFS
ncbi:MAG TPA: SatD family protein [Terriglobia bacterium]|nr:SatD family protein [Terriglobia bacterium]